MDKNTWMALDVARKITQQIEAGQTSGSVRIEDPLQAENERLQAALDSMTCERDKLFELLEFLAIGIALEPDGFGYRAKHGIDVVQRLWETIGIKRKP